jgi:hypothetical protein
VCSTHTHKKWMKHIRDMKALTRNHSTLAGCCIQTEQTERFCDVKNFPANNVFDGGKVWRAPTIRICFIAVHDHVIYYVIMFRGEVNLRFSFSLVCPKSIIKKEKNRQHQKKEEELPTLQPGIPMNTRTNIPRDFSILRY